MKRFYVLLTVVLMAVPAFANTFVLDFSGGAQGASTTISPNDWIFGSVNASPAVKYGDKANGGGASVVLFYVPSLPADLAGATITSATFSIKPTWNGQSTIANTELRRINTPANWLPGTGTWPTRYTAATAGSNWTFANANGPGGTKWDGTVTTWHDTSAPFTTTAMADLVDTKDVAGTGITTFNVLSLAQNWASGAWANKGFSIYNVNTATGIDDLTTAGLGLVINYTPAPEPATMSLLVLGGLAMLRRKA